ncbi:hypothetical protein GHK86_13325, partial [Acidimicrobiaceae bacterium USS-CC1]|nr:hypothetical protein [Acidiferrimicrobium australe]
MVVRGTVLVDVEAALELEVEPAPELDVGCGPVVGLDPAAPEAALAGWVAEPQP